MTFALLYQKIVVEVRSNDKAHFWTGIPEVPLHRFVLGNGGFAEWGSAQQSSGENFGPKVETLFCVAGNGHVARDIRVGGVASAGGLVTLERGRIFLTLNPKP